MPLLCVTSRCSVFKNSSTLHFSSGGLRCPSACEHSSVPSSFALSRFSSFQLQSYFVGRSEKGVDRDDVRSARWNTLRALHRMQQCKGVNPSCRPNNNDRDSSQMLLNHSFVPLYFVCIFLCHFICELVSASYKLCSEVIMRRMENIT